MPVVTTLSGKGALPETHPLSSGVLGALGGSDVARALVEEADLILAVGFKFGQNPTYRWTLPTTQKIIHLDIDGSEIGKLFPVAVGLVADATVGLAAMLTTSKISGQQQLPGTMEAVVNRINALKEKWRAQLAAAAAGARPIKPQQVAAVIDEVAGPDDVLVCDASFASGWGAMYFNVHHNRRALFPRGMAGLGWGLPAAIGAQIARPDSQIIVLAGDGAMTYCLGELATLAQEGLPVKVIVLNNSAMSWIKWEQAVFWEGKFQSTDLNDVNFALVAEGLGCHGARVDDPNDLQAAIKATLAFETPALLDVRTSASEAAVPKFTEAASARARMNA